MPIAVQERPELTVKVRKNPRIPKDETAIPCGCGGTLVYGVGRVETYTAKGWRVHITSIARYQCEGARDACGLVCYIPAVADSLDAQIEKAEAKYMKRQTTTPKHG